MRRVLFALAILGSISSQTMAADCGPRTTSDKIKNFYDTVFTVDLRLQDHYRALLKEEERFVSLQAFGDEFQKLNNEQLGLQSMQQNAERMEATLNTAWVVGIIRDAMINAADKTTANGYLSVTLDSVKRTAGKLQTSVATQLTRVARPGIAVDVARLRDTMAAIEHEFSQCTLPRRG